MTTADLANALTLSEAVWLYAYVLAGLLLLAVLLILACWDLPRWLKRRYHILLGRREMRRTDLHRAATFDPGYLRGRRFR